MSREEVMRTILAIAEIGLVFIGDLLIFFVIPKVRYLNFKEIN